MSIYLIPCDAAHELPEGLRAVGDTSQTAMWQHKWKNGAVRDVQCTSDASRDGDRPVRLVLAIDVTELKWAEETLALVRPTRRPRCRSWRGDQPQHRSAANASRHCSGNRHSFGGGARTRLVDERFGPRSGAACKHRPARTTRHGYSRVPIGQFKVGRIAASGQPFATNSISRIRTSVVKSGPSGKN